MLEITSNHFLAALVDPPKLRNRRHTLLVHARDQLMKEIKSKFPCSICGSTEYRNIRHTLLVHARDYIQFPCLIAGCTKVRGYETYTTPVESLNMKKKRQGAFPKCEGVNKLHPNSRQHWRIHLSSGIQKIHY